MTLVDVGIVLGILTGTGLLAAHHQFWRARQARIRAEADAFGGRLDESD